MAGMGMVSVDEILKRAGELEAAGGIVPAIALLEAAVAKYAVLPTDIVRVRLRLVDMYGAYTKNTELVRDHLARALKAVSTNSAVASRKVNSIRVSILLKLTDNQASTPDGMPLALKDADEAIQLSHTAKLHDLLPLAHMSKAYVLALMGDNAKAHAELGKAHQAASSRDEASDDANADSGDYKLAGGGFCPDAAMSLLLMAHLNLREGRLPGARASLRQARSEMLKSSHCPHDIVLLDASGVATSASEQERQPPTVVKGHGEGLKSGGCEADQTSLSEVAEYYLLLCAIAASFAGEVVLLPNMVGSLARISSSLWGYRGEGRGRQGTMMRWASDSMITGIVSFLKSAAMSAMPGGPRSPAPKEKPTPLTKLALDEVEKGIKGIGRGGGKPGAVAGVADAGHAKVATNVPIPSIRFYAPGYDDGAAVDHVAFLLYCRKAELLVLRGDFPTALETIIEAKQVLDVIKGGDLVNDGAVLEFAASLHCVIGQYCTRLGIHDGALAHFSMSEARSKSQGTRLHALLLRGMLVVDSPDAAAQRATDAAVLLAKADGMVKAQGDRGAGEWAISTLAYLRGKLAASSCTESEEAVAQMYEEMEGVERVIERAQAAGTSREIIVLLSVLRAEFMYKIGSMNSQIMATMVERSIDALGKAHVMVTEYGDIWLEVKVLRGLERGYVQVPARARVANASLTIMKSREKRLNEATAAALSHQLHSACIAWDLGEAN